MNQVHTCSRCGVTQRVAPDQTLCFDDNCAWPLDSPPPGRTITSEQPAPKGPPAPESPTPPPTDYQTPMGAEGKGYVVARRPGRLPSDGRGYRVLDAQGNPVEGGDPLTEEDADALAKALNTDQAVG